jgi:DNA-binding NtrC family response regulator
MEHEKGTRDAQRPGAEHPHCFTCLVVDARDTDEPALERSLDGSDLELVFASDAAEALRVLKQGGVDIVIAEECLPGTAGSALLEAVQHFWPEIARVLVGTDLGADVIARAVNRARVQRVLRRTLPADSLREEVEGALNEILLLRALSAAARAPRRSKRAVSVRVS